MFHNLYPILIVCNDKYEIFKKNQIRKYNKKNYFINCLNVSKCEKLIIKRRGSESENIIVSKNP